MLTYQVLAAILFISGSYALYDSYPDVIKLTPDNFDQLVTNSTDVWIVMFYAPWCGWSMVAVSEYTRAACALKGVAKLGAVDADKYDALGQRYGLTGYPLIKVFTGSKDEPYEYKRKAASYIEAVMDAIKNKANDNLKNGACKLSKNDQSSSSESEEDNKETTTTTVPETTTQTTTENTRETTTETANVNTAETTTDSVTVNTAETITETANVNTAETTTETVTVNTAETTTDSVTVNTAETTSDTLTTTSGGYDYWF